MRRLLLSFLILAGVAGLVGVGSLAFFSDTETSLNNYFQAGAIDLTVDARAYYNGFECGEEGWTCDPWADMVYSFDQGTQKDTDPVPADRSDPSKALGEPENNDTFNFYSLGLGIGGELVLKFDNRILNDAGNDLRIVETSFGNPSCAQYPERAEIYASKDAVTWEMLGTTCQDGDFDLGSLDYAYYVKLVDVTNPADFGSGDVDGFDVDGVTALHCDSVPTNIDGQICEGSWEATDLGLEHKLFDLNDLKPGDSGRHSWSLHVEDNDAYACVMPTNLVDSDEDIVEPEDEVSPPNNDNDDGTAYGDLSRSMNMIAWVDDGDAIWELSEDLLVGPMSAYDFFSGPGLQLPEIIPGTETAFVGINWCFGDMSLDLVSHNITCDGTADLNIAQTDSLTADMSFYVEQARHNDNFVCPNIVREVEVIEEITEI